ncbi:hypothetical protein ACLBR5_19975 [Escherichia coli]
MKAASGLPQCGLTVERLAAQDDPVYALTKNCIFTTVTTGDCRRRLSMARKRETAWCGEYDKWGNLLGETSAQHLQTVTPSAGAAV